MAGVRGVAAKTSSSRSCSYREVILVKKLRSMTNPRSISMIFLIKPSFYQWNSSNSLNCCFLRPCNMACREWSKSIMLKPLKKKKVPLFVMMPIDTFGIDTSGLPRIRRIKALTMSLKALKLAGVHGIAVEIGHLNGDIYYQDQNGFSNDDYLTLGVDHVPLFCGWTALQCYEDFMFSFVTKFESLLGSIIKEMSVGLGPAGELRYPAHPSDDGRWRFPGVGEFQCYDKYMLEDLKMAACQVGKPEWGNKGPQNAGYYNSIPSEVPFFEDGEESFLSGVVQW